MARYSGTVFGVSQPTIIWKQPKMALVLIESRNIEWTTGEKRDDPTWGLSFSVVQREERTE
jgi:hypothetical protein